MKFSAIAFFLCFFTSHARELEYQTLDYDYAFDEDPDSPRSLIMMIPDGTSPTIWALARAVLDPTLQTRLHVDPLAMGTVQTHSSTSYVTDSAAAATAYSTGYKTYDRAIGVDHFKQPVGTILEAAKARGMLTGMIVTSRVTHATPASFASHVEDRDDEDEIAQQYVKNKNLDFLLGGGAGHFTSEMYDDLQAHGYSIVRNYNELQAYKQQNQATGNLRVFGLFHETHMSFEVDRIRELEKNETSREPSLPEMVETILSLIKRNPVARRKGFFLLVEGSRVDHAGHLNDPGAMAKEAIAFDHTVGVVKDFIRTNKNVGLVSAADHGTGGLTLGMIDEYRWEPTELQKQTMSTEWMTDRMKEYFVAQCNTRPCDRAQVQNDLHAMALKFITSHTTAQRIEPDASSRIKDEILKAMDAEDQDFVHVTEAMGPVISKNARVGWTTIAHVGEDVILHCMGPSVLERLCKGSHQNTHVHKMMANYLNLAQGMEIETMRLRNLSTLTYTEVHDGFYKGT